MQENDQKPAAPQQVPPPPPPPPGQAAGPSAEEREASVRAELARARRRSKVLTAVAAVLGTIMVIAAGVGYVIYSRISSAKETFEEAFRALPPMPENPGQDRLMYGSGGPQSSTEGTSGLALLQTGAALPAGFKSPFTPEEAAQAEAAVAKYIERPVMKKFMEEMQKDPQIAKAIADTKAGGNPLALIAAAQTAPGMQVKMMKFAMDPQFLAVMMEMYKDPALQKVMKASGANVPAMPGAIGAQPQSATSRPAQREEEEGDGGEGEMTFDPSAISGQRQEGTVRKKAVPSPVESGR